MVLKHITFDSGHNCSKYEYLLDKESCKISDYLLDLVGIEE